MKRPDSFSMRIYGLSVVMVLILLCLTMFGVLSLASANAEKTLSDKNAAHLENYALCDAEAQERLAAVYTAAASVSTPGELPALLDALEYTCAFDGQGRVEVRFETEKQGRLSIAVVLTVDPMRQVNVESYRLMIEPDQGSGEQLTLWTA